MMRSDARCLPSSRNVIGMIWRVAGNSGQLPRNDCRATDETRSDVATVTDPSSFVHLVAEASISLVRCRFVRGVMFEA